MRKGRTGSDEINEVLDHLNEANRLPFHATPNRQLFIPGFASLSHGLPVEIFTLSPSDAEIANFHAWVGSEMPKAGETKRRLPKRIRNDVSVVVWIKVGSRTILLGADLEEEGRHDTGWSAVLGCRPGVPWDQAEIFKVPHHGSTTGHHDQVWSQMLRPEPIAVLAPWINGGFQLPSEADRTRLSALSERVFATATGRTAKPIKRERAVERTIAESVRTFIRAEVGTPGMVRLRVSASNSSAVWSIELSDTALNIKDWPVPA